MEIPSLNGKPRRVNLAKYRVNWDEHRASKAQFNAKQFFKKFWLADYVLEEMVIPGSRLRIDLINFSKKIVVEISGAQHETFVKFFHKSRLGFLKSVKRDFKKINWVENHLGFTFLEIYDKEVDSLSAEGIEKKFGIKIY